jgi:hypothetical protein
VDAIEVEGVIARLAAFAADIDFERNLDLSHRADLDDGEVEVSEVDEGESVVDVL